MLSFLSFFKRKPSFEEGLEQQITDKDIQDIQDYFIRAINSTRVEFNLYIATYFAYTVLTEGSNSLNSDLKLEDYKTVKELLTKRTMIKYPEDPTATLSESFNIITWEEKMEEYIKTFVNDKVDIICKRYVKTKPEMGYLYEDKNVTDIHKQGIVLEHVKKLVRKHSLEGVIEDFKEHMIVFQPRALFDHGKEQANQLLIQVEKERNLLEEGFMELAESISRVNRLYSEVESMYLETFKESTPKGKIDKHLYEARYKLMLFNLKGRQYPIEWVRELATLDTRYSPEVLKLISNFEYI